MNSRITLLLPVIAGACWGAAGLFVRPFAEAGFDNTTIIFSKASIGIPVTTLIILIYDRNLFRVKSKDLPFLAGVGFCGILLLSYAYNFAVTHLSLSLASILLCMAPIFGIIFYSEVPSVMGIAGMIITIAALIVLTGSKKKQDSE